MVKNLTTNLSLHHYTEEGVLLAETYVDEYIINKNT